MSIAINHILTVCVYKYTSMYIYCHEIFFPIHQCKFRWNCVQPSRYSAPAVFIIANRLHVSVHVYSVIHSLPAVIIRHNVYSLWIWMEMWDKQLICWYEVNTGNGSGADGDNVGCNLDFKKTDVDKCVVECGWMLMGFGDSVGQSILTHWGRVTQICVFNTSLFSLHNTLNL